MVDAVALPAHLTSLLGPGEVSDRDEEEGVALVKDTGESVVPSDEGSSETEATANVDENRLGASGAMVEVAEGEEEEGQVQCQEKQEEGDCRLESRQQ